MSGNYYSKEIKDEVISKIKAEGLTGAEAGRRYGINPKNIYRWLMEGIGGGNTHNLFELNRLKRENKELKEMIGKLVFEKERGKKG